jgi:hypothetical protein
MTAIFLEGIVGETAAKLDEVKPGWRNLITKPVNMCSSQCCIIGQVFGDFWDADLSKLGYQPNREQGYEMFQRMEWAIAHGLAVRGQSVGEVGERTLEAETIHLNQKWKAAVKTSLVAKAA